MKKWVLLAMMLGLAAPALKAQQALIDFEDLAGDTQPYLTAGYRLEATDFGVIRPTQSLDGDPSNNISVFPSFGFDDHSIEVRRQDGGTFSLLSFDLLEPFSLSVFPGPADFEVRGQREDGTELVWTVEVDGLNGPQTYHPVGFHNLSRVRFQCVGAFENAALDNLLLAESLIVYPQLALGGGFEILLFVTNRAETNFNGTASLNGGAWPHDSIWALDGHDQTGNSSFGIELVPNQTRRFVLSRRDDVAAGWLEIRPEPGSSCADLSTSFFYNFTSGAQLVDSTGVAPSPIAVRARFPVERVDDIRTGFAVRRPIGPVTFTLFSESGGQLQSVTAPFEGAKFADEIFFGIGASFVGSVEVESEGGFYLVVLRQELIGEGGFQLTSIPALTDP